MEFKDFPMLSVDVLVLSTDERIDDFQAGQAIFLQNYQDEWLAVQGDSRIRVNCAPADYGLFSRLVLRDQVRWLLTSKQSGKLLVQYCAPVEVSVMQLELGVDELIVEDIYNKHEIAEMNIDLACRWFAEKFLVRGLAEGDWLTVARFANSTSKGGFQLFGQGWRADVEQGANRGLLVKRVTRQVRRDGAYSLLVGQSEFRDASVAAVLNSASQQALLDAALRDNASYLELWNLYNDKEWQGALKVAETLRSLRFVQCVGVEDGRENTWHLTPKSQDDYREFRERWRNLELTTSTQVDLSNERPDWAEELATDEAKTAVSTPRGTIRFEQDCVVFKPASNRRDVRPKQAEGWLYLSLAGHRTVGKRRLAAKRSIDSGKRLPQLKWLLEGVPVPAARRRPINGLTPYAQETFKGGKPTENQKKALYAALNTPDLAIIIGPPGTGKTQVIAALQRRLAEEAQDQNIAAQVLISSFQHDAVDNALERSDVYGLPGARVGGKRGAGDDESLIDPWLERHSAHLQEKIAIEYNKYPELGHIRDLSYKLALARVAGASPSQQAEAFGSILHGLRDLDCNGLVLPPKLESQLEDYIEQLQQRGPSSAESRPDVQALRRIRALRVDVLAFNDDGSDRAWDLLNWLKRHGQNCGAELLALLQEAADSRQLPEPSLQALAVWQARLLEQFLPDYRPAELKYQADPEGLTLLDEIDRHLEDKLRQRKQGVAWVLEQLADSLAIDRTAAHAVVDEYSMVVGATCQQAAGQQMASLKSVAGLDSSEIEFDTVVVDEAARANPLDLFVPMAMAKRRIVLVGDDRQLPHMLEPDIEGQLQEEHQLTELQLVAFRSSLFERMRVKLQELEKKDNFRRVVMLDTQFRMHPILGDFVSKNFYEAVGMGEVFSGRTAADLAFDETFLAALGAHEAYYRDRVCQWIDMPVTLGKDQHRGTSRVREIEAERIADEVVLLMQAGGDSLSVGVITFYAAQRDLIMEKLALSRIDDVPLMELRNGSYEPHEQFKWVRKVRGDGSVSLEERLRVGSVDAFQGKEFDVVLLSCVRTYQSAKPNSISEDEETDREKQLNRQFGFLRLPNRMNVAMSRQRQMLICVGDAALATSPEAEKAVPALAAFYQMCGGEHGILR
ncbi:MULTISPECIES: AAA domain-containing protein [unclassified Pseudomonas]|jgi:DNA polymerase III delta prime subunit|uniref:DEAD/DEAH box helicase n=2 Tax=Pseudomonas TaxID=286 RepID=UPI0014731D88|nr:MULTISPECIES: AAA domain-containing protein [unclassified Pseudomonas]NMX89812.1 AAA family ATPase [Pseudomonas sp. WS 5086]NMY44079.1 AAA family ATPase [Pseudomonas sp. WS 5027]